MSWFRRKDTESIARERLKLILVQDRALLSPSLLEEMRKEIINVISKYLDIQQSDISIQIQRESRKTILAAILPVRGVKR